MPYLVSQQIFLTNKKDSAFSIFEVLFALIIMSLLGIGAIRNTTLLKKQDRQIQSFLLNHTSLYETQLFLQKYLTLSKPDSLVISDNTLKWQGYDKLFLPTKNNSTMDFSLTTQHYVLQFENNALYLNQSLVLQNVKSFKAKLQQSHLYKILEYKICTITCVQDFILLDETEILL